MFGFLKQNNTDVVLSPLAGNVMLAEDIPDEAFSEEMMGPTVGIEPIDDRIYAPFSGKVESVAEEKHSLLLVSDEGLELMIHVGLDTVKLKGEPFTVHVEEGAKIEQGDLLMSVDLDAIEAAGLSTITPIVVCNADDFGEMEPSVGRKREGEAIFRIDS